MAAVDPKMIFVMQGQLQCSSFSVLRPRPRVVSSLAVPLGFLDERCDQGVLVWRAQQQHDHSRPQQVSAVWQQMF